MSLRDDKVYLVDILEAAEAIAFYIEGLNQEEFLESPMVRDAVERRLFIIGEAANHLSPELKARHPEIVWHEVVGLRNLLAHVYFGVKPEVIWNTAVEDLPVLAGQVRAIHASGIGS